MTPCVVIFDVDGTLVDSQAHIMAAMAAAFRESDLPVPSRSEVLSGVGLSLDHLMARLAGHDRAVALADRYKEVFHQLRVSGQPSPLYPGTEAMLADLAAQPGLQIALATGKSRRGLDALIAEQGWASLLASHQSADEHPSKPHPSMIDTVLAETGVDRARAVMVGDTSFDMQMARAAGIASIAVPWGYHRVEDLSADEALTSWADLPGCLDRLWRGDHV